jgi:spore germination protein GerM
VFLLAEGENEGERLLRTVLRDVDSTPEAVLEELIKGPNPSEQDAGIRTAIPSALTLWSARPVAGTLNVDVSSEILDLPSTALRYAVAEIVYTASELDGVDAVRLRVDGEIRAWPDGAGVTQTVPLTVYDFPGMAESAQPPFPAQPTELTA